MSTTPITRLDHNTLLVVRNAHMSVLIVEAIADWSPAKIKIKVEEDVIRVTSSKKFIKELEWYIEHNC